MKYSAAGAPVDFAGYYYNGGRGLAVECKQTQDGLLSIDRFDEQQREALNDIHHTGADALIVASFHDMTEVYSAAWSDVAAFLALPFRASLTPRWFAAYGLRLKVTVNGQFYTVGFLDGFADPDQAAARFEMSAQAARGVVRAAKLEAPPVPQKSWPKGMTVAQYQERMLAAVNAGVERQLKAPRMAFKGRKRK